MHPDAAPSELKIVRVGDGATFQITDIAITSHYGCHVWRREMKEVALIYFEVSCCGSFRFVFCGDADYTAGFPNVAPDLDTLFITWRNPGPKFEDGHSEQIATTFDAVSIVVNELTPRRLILQHYGELDHVYKGFAASYEMAVDLIARLLVPTSIHFWGDQVNLVQRTNCSLICENS